MGDDGRGFLGRHVHGQWAGGHRATESRQMQLMFTLTVGRGSSWRSDDWGRRAVAGLNKTITDTDGEQGGSKRGSNDWGQWIIVGER